MEGNEKECTQCSKPMGKNEEFYQCDVCNNMMHKICTGLTPSEIKCIPLQKRVLRLLCQKCKSFIDKLPNLISVIEDMKNEIKILKEAVLESNKVKSNNLQCLHQDMFPKSYARATAEGSESLNYPKKITNNFPMVIIKPKKNQDSTVTKKEVLQKINPAELNIGVNNIKLAKSGNITIKCSSREDADKLKNMAVTKLKNTYEVEETKLKKPRIKIIGFTESKNEEELEQLIRKQNKHIEDNDELKITYIKKTKTVGSIIFAECSPVLFNKIMYNRKLYIGWERCSVYEDIGVPQCFKCKGFYHKDTNCTNKTVCGYCGGEHNKNECQKLAKKCSNCENANHKYKTQYDINHEADNKECPSYKYQLQILKNKIDYGQQVYG